MSQGLTYRLEQQTLHIDFVRPDAANAFSPTVAAELKKILNKYSQAKALVWRSPRQKIFCSGGDLKYYSGLKNKLAGIRANRQIAASLKLLRQFQGRTLAVVEGDCFGGGIELIACFDEVWLTPAVQLGLWQRRVGLSFGWGGYAALLERLGPQRLKVLSLGADRLSSLQSWRLGLVDRLVLPSLIDDQVSEWLKAEMQLPSTAGRALKKLNLKNEQKTFASLWWSGDHLNILKRFGNKS